MRDVSFLIEEIESCAADRSLRRIYSEDRLDSQKARYSGLLRRHLEFFGNVPAAVISAPGRTELGGNHTDHNLGKVLAASVEFDTLCTVSFSGTSVIRFHSDGWAPLQIDCNDLEKRDSEKETTAALLRGIMFRFRDLGFKTGGFDCCVNSEVLQGSGLSSSASLEVLIGTVLSELFNDGEVSLVDIAKIGQFAENNYFGKASGLMDQLACAGGGITGIDFRKPESPVLTPFFYDFRKKGWVLVAVATESSHANLSDEYSRIPAEMRCVAEVSGKKQCREIGLQELISEIPSVRKRCGDRAVLRAFHFLKENNRVGMMLEALKEDRLGDYFTLVNESGNSSFKYLQNIYVGSNPEEQGVSLALAFTDDFLDGEGACRIQGGGFAGTIQAYVPEARVDNYTALMESIFGKGSVIELRIRSESACRVI